MNDKEMAYVFLKAIKCLILIAIMIAMVFAADCGSGKVAVRGFWGWPVCVRSEQ
jgi:formate/nitrite transporter FocA (FNT family)